MDLTNETHGHRWYKWGRGIAWSFFSVRRSIRRPDEGCISLTVSFPSMPFMQLFELTLTSSTNLFSSLSFLLLYYRSLFFLSPLSLLFSPFSYTFDLLVKTAIEQGVIFRRDQYLLSSHSLLFPSSRVSLFWYCSGAIDTGTVDMFLDLIVERVSANLLTIAPL